MKTLLFMSLIISGLVLTSCEKKTEGLDIYATQQCLNKVDETEQSKVLACLDKISKYDSAEANIVRCSILQIAGGLTGPRSIDAIKARDDINTTAMMTYFAIHTYSTPAENKLAAQTMQTVCEKSGEKSLIGLAGFSSMGTLLCNGALNCTANSSEAGTETLLNDCASESTCSAADKKTIGNIGITLVDKFCSHSNENQYLNDDLI